MLLRFISRLIIIILLVYAYCAVEIIYGVRCPDENKAILFPTTVGTSFLTLVILASAEPGRRCMAVGLWASYMGLNRFAVDLNSAWPMTSRHFEWIVTLRWLVFVGLAFLFTARRCNLKEADTLVAFAPHEEQVRQIVRRYEPSQLHRVDEWLSQYRTREVELIQLLHDQYSSIAPSSRIRNSRAERRQPQLSPIQATPSALLHMTDRISSLHLG